MIQIGTLANDFLKRIIHESNKYDIMNKPKLDYTRKYIKKHNGTWKIVEDDVIITPEMFRKYLSCFEGCTGWIRVPIDYRNHL